jgi:signal transduction histidine kinase
MLGLGLVVGIMALLLGGTLFGLVSYMATMKTVDAKLAELDKAEKLKQAAKDLAQSPPASLSPDQETEYLLGKLQEAHEALEAYRQQLQQTVDKNRDPDGGELEKGFTVGLEERFQRLSNALTGFKTKPEMVGPVGLDDDHPASNGQVKAAIADLVVNTDSLSQVIYGDLYKRSTVSKGYYKTSLTIVLSTSILGVILMAGLLRFFYGWVFYPVRDLQLGAVRVAQGNFGHPIEVNSGDEMQELARAFNYMQERVCERDRDLTRQVNERSRQLVRSERLASVGFLAAGVAHEINNPLQAITLYSGALEARLAELVRRVQGREDEAAVGPDEYEVITKYLKTILEEAFRCKRITERLLEFSRGGEPHRELIDLTELVQSVLDVAEPLQHCKGKAISFEPSGQVTAWGNADEIKSVVLNLVINSLDSMDEGGRLTIRLRPDGDMAELVLTDTGCGMTGDVLENIFEPFFTRSRTGKGTGLGLTISHRIITQHGGEILADSPGPDQGSTFTVRLPRHPAEDHQVADREITAAAAPEPALRKAA